MKIFRFLCTVALATATLPAQTLQIQLPASFAASSEKAEIHLDSGMLALAKQLPIPDLPPELLPVLNEIQELHVVVAKFEKAGQYSASDMDSIRDQLAEGSGWSSVVNVQEKEDDGIKTVEGYVFKEDSKLTGLLVIAAEPTQVAIVHVIGSIDADQLKEVVNSTIAYDLSKAGGSDH